MILEVLQKTPEENGIDTRKLSMHTEICRKAGYIGRKRLPADGYGSWKELL